MAYTNAQLARQMIGDRGATARDTSSGDGTATEFYLSSPPLIDGSQVVTVDGTEQTEVASSPAAGEYTIDNQYGLIAFGSAPGVGSGNIVVRYLAVDVPDEDVAEALRQYGLTATDTADTGLPLAIMRAAIMLCESQAARYAIALDQSTDGQSFTGNSSASDRWRAQADLLRAALTKEKTGIAPIPIIRVDGYSDDITSRDVGAADQNPRRRFYGEKDRIP